MSIEQKPHPSTLYFPRLATLVSGFSHAEVQGEPVSPSTFPYVRRRCEVACPVVVPKPSPENAQLKIQISSIHGRSFEKVGYLGTTQIYDVLTQDEFGNYFLAISEKGNNLLAPRAFKSPVSPAGFTIYGMQDSLSILRVIKASAALRKLHISTEALNRVIQLQEVIFNNEKVSIPIFRQKIMALAWIESEEKRESDNDLQPVNREDIPALGEYLDKNEFFMTERSMVVNERLADFNNVRTKSEFIDLVSKIFTSLQLVNELTQASINDTTNKEEVFDPNTYEEQGFDPSSEEDREEYFATFLPNRLMLFLSKMHEQGLHHKYLHAGNLMGDGGFCDLDSVTGPILGLGDPEVTAEEQGSELVRVCEEYYKVLLRLSVPRFLPFAFVHKVNRDSEEYTSLELNSLQARMLTLYIFQRKKNVLEVLTQACKFNKYLKKELLNQYLFYEQSPFMFDEALPFWDILCSDLGWQYWCELSSQDIIDQVINDQPTVYIKDGERPSVEQLLSQIVKQSGELKSLADAIEAVITKDFQQKMSEKILPLRLQKHPDVVDIIQSISVNHNTFLVLSQLFQQVGFEIEKTSSFSVIHLDEEIDAE